MVAGVLVLVGAHAPGALGRCSQDLVSCEVQFRTLLFAQVREKPARRLGAPGVRTQ